MKQQARVWWTDEMRLKVDRLSTTIGCSRSAAIVLLVRAALDHEGPEAEAVRAFRRRAPAAAARR